MGRLILIVLASVCLSTCSRRDGLNFDCEWVADRTFEVNLETEPDVRHLLDDIRAAEELAIRYGDRIAGWRLVDTFGIVSRHGGVKNRDAGRLAQQECIARLFNIIGSTHGLSVPEIEGVRPRLLERGLDLPVTAPVALLFAFALRRFTRWLRNRFEPDELLAWVIATVIGSVILTTIVLAVGAAWAVLVEIAHVGNEHLSYRARTASLRNNFLVMFIIGIALAWLSSASAAVQVTRRTAGR
ncbi:MAG: hypothetical protein ACRD1W_12835 [Vicinamibacterales bacterium]